MRYLRVQASVISIDQLTLNPYKVQPLRNLIDMGAFRIYGHWVKKAENQNRAALFENYLRQKVTEEEDDDLWSLPFSPKCSHFVYCSRCWIVVFVTLDIWSGFLLDSVVCFIVLVISECCHLAMSCRTENNRTCGIVDFKTQISWVNPIKRGTISRL